MTFDFLKKQAQDLVESGRYKEAIPILQSLVEMDPKNYLIWFILGRTYEMSGARIQSIECLLKSGKLNKKFYDTYLYLAQIYANDQDVKNTEKYVNKALKVDPNLAAAWALLGVAHQNIGNNQKALDYFLKANKLDPTDEQIRGSLSMIRGRIAQKQMGNKNTPGISMSFFSDGLDITEKVEKSRKEFEQKPSIWDGSGPRLQLNDDDDIEEPKEDIVVKQKIFYIYSGIVSNNLSSILLTNENIYNDDEINLKVAGFKGTKNRF